MRDNEVTWKMRELEGEKSILVPCIECRQKTNHRLRASLDCHGGNNYTDFWIDYQLAQCLGCDTVTFVTTSSHSEDWDHDEDGNVVIPSSTTYYPSRSAGRSEIDDHFMLPIQIQRIYSETVKALNNDQPILTGIGVRALIETICKEKSAVGKDLQKRIDWLVSEKILTQNDADVLHKIRTLGNSAAHEATPHSADQLTLALDICEHLMKGVYLIPQYVAHRFK